MSYEVFENIDYENLNSLFILANNDFRNISDIKLNYSKEYNFLQENLNFLIDYQVYYQIFNYLFLMIFLQI